VYNEIILKGVIIMTLEGRLCIVAKEAGEALFGDDLLWGEGDPFVGISSPGADIVDFFENGVLYSPEEFSKILLGGDGYWFAYDSTTNSGFPTEEQEFTWEDVNSWYINHPQCMLAYYAAEEHAIHSMFACPILNNLEEVVRVHSPILNNFYNKWEEYLAH